MLDLLLTIDWSMLGFILVGLSFGTQRSEQRSDSGGPLSSSTGTLRGQMQAILARTLVPESGGNLQPFLQAVLGRAAAPTMFETTTPTPLDELGLFPGQRQAFTEAVNQAFSGASGSLARRGFVRPEILPAVAASAAQQVAPAFAPLIGQQTQAQDQFRQALLSQAQLVPEQIRQARLAEFLQLLQSIGGLLGQQAASFGGSRGFQFGLSLPGVSGQAPSGSSQPSLPSGSGGF